MDMEVLTHVPRRMEAVDCFNCSSLRRQCDRTRHRCETCSQCSEACGGYPRDWQWLPGVKSRGKHKGSSMSIAASSREWHPTTPINHSFVFKQGNPQKKRSKCNPNRLKPKPAHSSKKASSESSVIVTPGNQQQSHPLVSTHNEPPLPTSVADVADASRSLPLTTDELCNPSTLGHMANMFDSLDSTLLHDFESTLLHDFESTLLHNFESTLLQDFDADDSNMLMPPVSIESVWPYQTGSWPLPTIDHPPTTGLSLSPSLPGLETSELLKLYDTELCVLPLTYDYDANPLRCIPQGSEHSAHAILAFCMQYLSRFGDASPDGPTGQQIATYRHSAKKLFAFALPAATQRLKERVFDTAVILFNLDSFTSAAGPWHDRLATAFQLIESIGGLSALSMSPRLHAQLTMFIWWDCNISLFARSEPIFPSYYHDLVLSYDQQEASNIFALSAVSKELFQYFRELASLACEKEQVSKMKYANFNNKRVLELERCIRDYTVQEFNPRSAADSEAGVHAWYDYFHGINAWKYGLLLYITRVLKWDRTGEPCRHEIASLSRMVLDSVRCCSPDLRIQKQLLHPMFLAGSESSDSYSRKFVVKYFEEWYQLSRYAMFKDALELLRVIWDEKDQNNNDSRIWWGSVAGNMPPNGSQFLLG